MDQKEKYFNSKQHFSLGKSKMPLFDCAFFIKALDLNIKNDLQYKKVS
jgi:hypothetical protein